MGELAGFNGLGFTVVSNSGAAAFFIAAVSVVMADFVSVVEESLATVSLFPQAENNTVIKRPVNKASIIFLVSMLLVLEYNNTKNKHNEDVYFYIHAARTVRLAC